MGEADELARARVAYEAGDLVQAARLAEPLLRAEDPGVRAEAERMLRAVRPDPVEVAVIVVCLLGLMGITWHYLL